MIRHVRHGQVSLVRIERHERRNALDVEHLDGLYDGVTEAVCVGARAVVVTGEGSAFCAGADLSGIYGDGFRRALYRTLGLLRSTPVPVLAAVNGPAIGAGTQLAIACDLRVADTTALFAVPTARNGLAVDPWTVRRLVQVAGAAARPLLLGAVHLDRDCAQAAGLVDRRGNLDDALEFATDIASMAPLSLAYSKRALAVLDEVEEESPELQRLFDACWSSHDVAEAHKARTERRNPVFEGR